MKKTPIAILTLVGFLITSVIGPLPRAGADEFRLPAPGVMVHLSPEFNPPVLKGIKIHPDNPLSFDFILDKGDNELSKEQIQDESSKLIKYFLASLTIPEKDLWVNLSPYEKDRIIPQSFGLTEMGRDLLAEDYMLKQITASLIYPEDEIGKKFWKRVYEEASKKYGTTNIPVNTFNKVWIVPEKAVVYENAKAGTAYVVEAKLKVMLEEDYLSLSKHQGQPGDMASAVSPSTLPSDAGLNPKAPQGGTPSTNALGSQIIREIVIPELTKEVNENKNFAHLRQVYNSLILATWYKKKIKDSILSQVYSDKNKVAGVNTDDPQEKVKIYQRYLQAFKKGVYNYIKEDQDPITQEVIPRKYFSGGMDMALLISENHVLVSATADQAQKAIDTTGNTLDVSCTVQPESVIQGRPVYIQSPVQKEELDKQIRGVADDFNNVLPILSESLGQGLFTRFMGMSDILDITQLVLGKFITKDQFESVGFSSTEADFILARLKTHGYLEESAQLPNKYKVSQDFRELDATFRNNFKDLKYKQREFNKIIRVLRKSFGLKQKASIFQNNLLYKNDETRWTDEERLKKVEENVVLFNAFKKDCLGDLQLIQSKLQHFLINGGASAIATDNVEFNGSENSPFSLFSRNITNTIKIINDNYIFNNFDLNKLLRKSLENSNLNTPVFTLNLTSNNPITVYGDPYKLGEVFTSLVKNAGEAISLWISSGAAPTAKGIINVEASLMHNEDVPDVVIIRIKDNGPGMTEEVKNKLFSQKHTAQGISSSNIGLMRIQEIINSHGGDIAVEKTKLGEGTTFRITLLVRSIGKNEQKELKVTKGAFVHDFNNILSVVIGYVDLLRMSNQEIGSNILDITNSTEKLRKIVSSLSLRKEYYTYDDINDFNKARKNMYRDLIFIKARLAIKDSELESIIGKNETLRDYLARFIRGVDKGLNFFEDRFEEFNLEQMMGSIWEDIKDPRIEYIPSFIPEGVRIFSNQPRLDDVLRNIMKNGKEAILTKEKEQQIKGLAFQGFMAVRGFISPQQERVIEISTNGGAMPQGLIDRILSGERGVTTKALKKYGVNTTEITGEGTGLPSCLKIIKGLQGTMNIISDQEKGTTIFKITLPERKENSVVATTVVPNGVGATVSGESDSAMRSKGSQLTIQDIPSQIQGLANRGAGVRYEASVKLRELYEIFPQVVVDNLINNFMDPDISNANAKTPSDQSKYRHIARVESFYTLRMFLGVSTMSKTRDDVLNRLENGAQQWLKATHILADSPEARNGTLEEIRFLKPYSLGHRGEDTIYTVGLNESKDKQNLKFFETVRLFMLGYRQKRLVLKNEEYIVRTCLKAFFERTSQAPLARKLTLEIFDQNVTAPQLREQVMESDLDKAIRVKGGIDLTPANMNLQTQNAGQGIRFHMDPAVLQRLQNAPGFVPVIINIQPMTNLRIFLGLSDNQSGQQTASI